MKSVQLLSFFCENSADCVLCYLACLGNGVVPLLIDRKIDDEPADTLIERYKPQYYFLPKDMESRSGNGKIIYTLDTYAAVKLDNERYPINDEPALLLTTSGSVGSPKLVRQSYKNIQSNAEAISTYLELDEAERAITTLPMNYTYGLSIINSHICSGASIIMTKSSVISKAFWDLFKAHRATSFGGVPVTYEMLKKIKFFKMEIPSLRTMTQSGTKMPHDLYREFAEYAKANGKRFVAMYGQTEATSRMSWLPPELATEKIGSIGRAIPGGKLILIDQVIKQVVSDDEISISKYFSNKINYQVRHTATSTTMGIFGSLCTVNDTEDYAAICIYDNYSKLIIYRDAFDADLNKIEPPEEE
ncbi:MAG: AMP-binding protein [Ruminococcus sp.]|nr:AMP-binding protein [Ruminococcus sp.]